MQGSYKMCTKPRAGAHGREPATKEVVSPVD